MEQNNKTSKFNSGLDFSNQRFEREDFSEWDLRGANFTNSTLYFCKFNGADLTNANFEGADLTGSRMIRCILRDINLRDATIDFVDFSNTEIKENNIQETGAKTKHYPIGNFRIYNNGIYLGKYQGEDVSCRALEYDNDKNELLMITEDIIDCKKYHDERKDITWENGNLRNYLNNIMHQSIRYWPRMRPIVSQNSNDDNPFFNTTGGNPTKDYLFLLSQNEINNYFINDQDRQTKGTSYAKKGKDDCELVVNEKLGTSYWWLRSPGADSYEAAFVDYDGGVYSCGISVVNPYFGVRPALRIKFKS